MELLTDFSVYEYSRMLLWFQKLSRAEKVSDNHIESIGEKKFQILTQYSMYLFFYSRI